VRAVGCTKSKLGDGVTGKKNLQRKGDEVIRTLFLYNIEKIQIFIVIFFVVFCFFNLLN